MFGRPPRSRGILQPVDPGRRNARRHFPAVTCGIPSVAAISGFDRPALAASAIRLRSASACGVEGERTNCCSSESVTGFSVTAGRIALTARAPQPVAYG